MTSQVEWFSRKFAGILKIAITLVNPSTPDWLENFIQNFFRQYSNEEHSRTHDSSYKPSNWSQITNTYRQPCGGRGE